MKFNEWLLTNGLGDYALGTSDELCHDEKHCLFMGVVHPPLTRRVCLRQLYEEIELEGVWYGLGDEADRSPAVGRPPLVRDFSNEQNIPAYAYQFGGQRFSKILWMAEKRQAIYIRYMNTSSQGRLHLRVQPLIPVAAEDDLSDARNRLQFREDGFAWWMVPEDLWVHCTFDRQMVCTTVNNIRSVELQEKMSTLQELNYVPAAASFEIAPGESITLCVSLARKADEVPPPGSLQHIIARNRALYAPFPEDWRSDRILGKLLMGGDQYIIERSTLKARNKSTILRGFPGAKDRPRETLLALPGLLLATGRHAEARQILLMLREHAAGGELPESFPDYQAGAGRRHFDTALWYFIVVYEYWEAAQDEEFIAEIFPFLLDLLNTYFDGHCPGVSIDAEDGLLANVPESPARTWMQAVDGNWEPTPRIGKPIEIQGLWFNVLSIMTAFARLLGKSSGEEKTSRLAFRVQDALQRKFWLPAQGYFADVICGEDVDATLRPNQILAFGLPYSPFTAGQIAGALESIKDELVTPFGLRSLSPRHPSYRYGPGPTRAEVAGAWHNGIVHPWLVLPYVRAALRAGMSAEALYLKFSELFRNVNEDLLGHIPEAFEAQPPYHPLGAPASAISQAAVLQSYLILKKLL